MKKIYIASFVVVLAIFGAYFFPLAKQSVIKVGSAGDVNNSPRMLQLSLDLSTTTPTYYNATSASFNSDSRDRIITSVEYYFTGLGVLQGATSAGISAFQVRLATSTDIYSPTSGNYLLYTTVSTTTAPILFVTASTSPGATGVSGNDYMRVWKAGTYLNLFTNATSTTMTGFLIVNYKVAP